MGRHSRRDVANGYADPGAFLGRAIDGEETALGLDQQVVGLLVAIRSVFAIAGDGTGDELRISQAEGLAVQAETRGRSGREVLDEDVSFAGHRQQEIEIGLRPQIEADGFLAAVQPDEIRTLTVDECVVAASEVAFWTLDLEDARTTVRQHAGGVGGGDGLLQRYDEQPFEIRHRYSPWAP